MARLSRGHIAGFAAGVAASVVVWAGTARTDAQDGDEQIRLQALVNTCIQRHVALVVVNSRVSVPQSSVNAWTEVNDRAAVDVCLQAARAKLR
jgi:hypothetical protein